MRGIRRRRERGQATASHPRPDRRIDIDVHGFDQGEFDAFVGALFDAAKDFVGSQRPAPPGFGMRWLSSRQPVTRAYGVISHGRRVSPPDVNRCTYRVVWSDRDKGYVATAIEFPSLSWIDEDKAEALNGLVRLINAYEDEAPLPRPEPADVPGRYLIFEGRRIYGIHEGAIATDENRREWTLKEGRWVPET